MFIELPNYLLQPTDQPTVDSPTLRTTTKDENNRDYSCLRDPFLIL